MHLCIYAAAAAKSLLSCPTLCDPIDLPGSPRPWDSPGKNTGVGCHFLLQCVKVKNESEFAQSCPTLSDSMDCSPPGSSIHGIFQARVLEWGAIAFSLSLSLSLSLYIYMYTYIRICVCKYIYIYIYIYIYFTYILSILPLMDIASMSWLL